MGHGGVITIGASAASTLCIDIEESTRIARVNVNIFCFIPSPNKSTLEKYKYIDVLFL